MLTDQRIAEELKAVFDELAEAVIPNPSLAERVSVRYRRQNIRRSAGAVACGVGFVGVAVFAPRLIEADRDGVVAQMPDDDQKRLRADLAGSSVTLAGYTVRAPRGVTVHAGHVKKRSSSDHGDVMVSLSSTDPSTDWKDKESVDVSGHSGVIGDHGDRIALSVELPQMNAQPRFLVLDANGVDRDTLLEMGEKAFEEGG